MKEPAPQTPTKNGGYMEGMLDDKASVNKWVKAAAGMGKREFSGYIITDGIDGESITGRRVSLVKVTGERDEQQHYHENANTFFIFTAVNGKATLKLGASDIVICMGMEVEVPKGTPHGFKIEGSGSVEFVSIQHPAIRGQDGHEDLHDWNGPQE